MELNGVPCIHCASWENEGQLSNATRHTPLHCSLIDKLSYILVCRISNSASTALEVIEKSGPCKAGPLQSAGFRPNIAPSFLIVVQSWGVAVVTGESRWLLSIREPGRIGQLGVLISEHAFAFVVIRCNYDSVTPQPHDLLQWCMVTSTYGTSRTSWWTFIVQDTKVNHI